MLRLLDSIFTEYLAHLRSRNIPPTRNSEYTKWLRNYLDFCNKYPVPTSKAERVRLFCDKLKEKRQKDAQRERAAHAVSFYFEMLNCETACIQEHVQSHEVARSYKTKGIRIGRRRGPFDLQCDIKLP